MESKLLSQIYDVIAFSLQGNDLDELRFFGLGDSFLNELKNREYVTVINNKIMLLKKAVDLMSSKVLRENWINLDHKTRQRLLNKDSTPTLDDLEIHVPIYLNKKNMHRILDKILNYKYKKHKESYAISTQGMQKELVNFIKYKRSLKKGPYKKIVLVNSNDVCLIGLDKEECDRYWKFDEGESRYAHRDFKLDAMDFAFDTFIVEIRFYLTRLYSGVIFELKNPYDLQKTGDRLIINYSDIIKVLKKDSIDKVIYDAPHTGNFEGCYYHNGEIIISNVKGFIPIYTIQLFKRGRILLLDALKKNPTGKNLFSRAIQTQWFTTLITNVSRIDLEDEKYYTDKIDENIKEINERLKNINNTNIDNER